MRHHRLEKTTAFPATPDPKPPQERIEDSLLDILNGHREVVPGEV